MPAETLTHNTRNFIILFFEFQAFLLILLIIYIEFFYNLSDIMSKKENPGFDSPGGRSYSSF